MKLNGTSTVRSRGEGERCLSNVCYTAITEGRKKKREKEKHQLDAEIFSLHPYASPTSFTLLGKGRRKETGGTATVFTKRNHKYLAENSLGAAQVRV